MEISLSTFLYFTYSILRGNFTGLFQIQFTCPVTSRRSRNFLNRYYLPSSATACRFLLSFLHFYNLSFSLGILMFCTKQVSCDRRERDSMRETSREKYQNRKCFRDFQILGTIPLSFSCKVLA